MEEPATQSKRVQSSNAGSLKLKQYVIWVVPKLRVPYRGSEGRDNGKENGSYYLGFRV